MEHIFDFNQFYSLDNLARDADNSKDIEPAKLIKISITAEKDPEDMESAFYINTAKLTFYFDSDNAEKEADELITMVKEDSCFIGCDKKFKQGKINKAGEVIRPDAWYVTVKYKV